MNKKGSFIIGIIFVVLGVLFLLKNLNVFNFHFIMFDIGFLISRFWALLFLILPGIGFHSIYFSGKNKDAGILVPGGILLVTGITCQLSMSFGIWGIMWPGFILAVAVGLFELYLFGNRDRGILIPVSILGALSFIFFTSISLRPVLGLGLRNLAIPVVLIVIGIIIILGNGFRKK